MTNCKSLMHEVQTTGFALTEAMLYLDTHPNCPMALDYFVKMREKCEQAKAEYEKEIGPLTVYGVDTDHGWTWTGEPMPWQMN